MPRITLISDFDWYPPDFRGRWMRAYKTGWTGLVTTPCAAAAIAAGKANKIGSTAEPGESPAEAGGATAGGTQRRKTGARAKR